MKNPKMIFDTNMFYNFLGVRKVSVEREKLKKFVDKNSCYITSVTLVEFLVYFKDDYTYIKKVINDFPCWFGLLDISYMSLDHEVKSFIESQNDSDLDLLVSKACALKIEQESEKIQFFFHAVSYIVAWIIFEKKRSDKSQNVSEVDIRALKYLYSSLKGNAKYILEKYEEYLKIGYRNQDGLQKIIKKEFDLDINDISYFMVIMYYSAVNGIDITHNNITFEEIKEQLNLDFENDFFLKRIKEQSLSAILRTKDYKMDASKLLTELLNEFSENPVFKGFPLVIAYLNMKMNKLLFQGSKFKINDVSDMLLLYFLSIEEFKDEELLLITLDNELLELLYDNGNNSKEFMDSQNFNNV